MKHYYSFRQMARESNLSKDNKSLYLSEVSNPLVLIHRNIILDEHINEKIPVTNGNMPASPLRESDMRSGGNFNRQQHLQQSSIRNACCRATRFPRL